MLALRNCTFAYDDTPVLKDVSLTVDPGEFLLLAGPNGSGKTTLIRHCNGLLTPDSGSVLVDGTPVTENLVGARTAVGMVFQQPRDQFVGATVEADVTFGPSNLGLPRAEIDNRVAEALAAVGMADHREARIDELSGGEQARVAIAGALAMNPSYLLLDEPLEGLDWPARQQLYSTLQSCNEAGMAVVVVTHDPWDLVGMADRLVYLENGEIRTELDLVETDPATCRERLSDHELRVPPADGGWASPGHYGAETDSGPAIDFGHDSTPDAATDPNSNTGPDPSPQDPSSPSQDPDSPQRGPRSPPQDSDSPPQNSSEEHTNDS